MEFNKDYDVYNNGEYIGVLAKDRPITMYEASYFCNTIGSSLASINNETDNNAAVDAMDFIDHNIDLAWIGLVDIVTENDYIWLGSTSDMHYSYSYWSGSSTYRSHEECTAISTSNGGWTGRDCDYALSGFICNSINNNTVSRVDIRNLSLNTVHEIVMNEYMLDLDEIINADILYCGDTGSCSNKLITNVPFIICDGDESCQYSNISASYRNQRHR